MTGHWGWWVCITGHLTFTDTGFPPELIKELEDRTGHKVIGNITESGTEIIKDLGEEHMRAGDLIVSEQIFYKSQCMKMWYRLKNI